jgi:hypothetical protein
MIAVAAVNNKMPICIGPTGVVVFIGIVPPGIIDLTYLEGMMDLMHVDRLLIRK